MMRLLVVMEFFFIIIILSRFGLFVGAFTDGVDTPLFHSCGPPNTDDINLESDLNDLFSNLTSEAESTGFADKAINPGKHDQFNGLIMCYADSTRQDCSYCLDVATKNATIICPGSSDATFTYDSCFLRYSNSSSNFIGTPTLDGLPNYYRNMGNVIISNTLNETVPQLLNSLRLQATSSASKYAYGYETDPGMKQTVYGLVQCTSDLNRDNCGICLQYAIGNISNDAFNDYFEAQTPPQSVRLSYPNCYIRYELYPLPLLNFNSPSPAPAPVPVLSPPSLAINFTPGPSGTTQQKIGARGLLKKILAASVATAAALVLLTVGFITWLWRRQPIATTKSDCEESTVPLEHQAFTNLKCYSELKVFQLETLTLATDNFSDENKLGEGGFGSVYKGSLIDGQRVAVKRLSGSSRQGLAELKNEVDLLAKLKHRNLVQLLGCCIQQKEKLLCYEFLPNGSLDNFLYANEAIRREEINWQTRYRIIQGICRGLEYLHEESRFKIVHRDLKPSNILLDTDMTPKISDFGLARLFNEDQTHKDTSTIAGTFGYIALEYILHGTFSAKSDVYSFGVLLLDIVTGRKISSFANSELACSLNSYVWQHVSEGNFDQLKDPALDNNACMEEVSKCIHIGLLCVQEDPTKRPSMADIGIMLDNNYSATIPPLPSSITQQNNQSIKGLYTYVVPSSIDDSSVNLLLMFTIGVVWDFLVRFYYHSYSLNFFR